jgi:hypothetical protein
MIAMNPTEHAEHVSMDSTAVNYERAMLPGCPICHVLPMIAMNPTEHAEHVSMDSTAVNYERVIKIYGHDSVQMYTCHVRMRIYAFHTPQPNSESTATQIHRITYDFRENTSKMRATPNYTLANIIGSQYLLLARHCLKIFSYSDLRTLILPAVRRITTQPTPIYT